MKPGLAQIIGRAITRVVVAKAPHGPGTQVVLVFADGESFDLYGAHVSCTSGIDLPGCPGLDHIEATRPGSIIAVYCERTRCLVDRAFVTLLPEVGGMHRGGRRTLAFRPMRAQR